MWYLYSDLKACLSDVQCVSGAKCHETNNMCSCDKFISSIKTPKNITCGKYLCNEPISCSFDYKISSKSTELIDTYSEF